MSAEMSTAKKVLITLGAIMTINALAGGVEIATAVCTSSANPANLITYVQLKHVINNVEDRTDIDPIKRFVEGKNASRCLIAVQTKDILGNLHDHFYFYKSQADVPSDLKNDSTCIKNWDAVRRYIQIKEREKKEQKLKEKEREAKIKQKTQNK